MRNFTFERALKSISHPISIAAIAVVLLNDHLLRHAWPSWLTGKLSDFAWLIFAPFLLMAILAWIPLRSNRRDEIVGYGSIIGTGLIFGLAKTLPEFHAFTIKILEALTGWPNVLRIDSTDTLALPALLIAWWIWKQSASRSIGLPSRGWILLPLAVLATMADSPAPNYGIACLTIEADGLVGSGNFYQDYISHDGGLSWNTNTGNTRGSVICHMTAWQLTDPASSQIVYRFNPGISIDRSNDGGQTWRIEFDLSGEEARHAYVARSGLHYYSSQVGPSDAVIDAASGNLVVAMGHEGVLVRTPDGHWQWVAVDDYALPDLRRTDAIVTLLSGELLLAVTLFALTIGTVARRLTGNKFSEVLSSGLIALGFALAVGGMSFFWNSGVYDALIGSSLIIVSLILLVWRLRRKDARRHIGSAIRILIWLAWAGTLIIFQPAKSSGYADILPALSSVAMLIFAVPWAVSQLRAINRFAARSVGSVLVIALCAAVLFLLPFVVWSQSGIPCYGSAELYAFVRVLAVLIGGHRYIRQRIDRSSPPAV